MRSQVHHRQRPTCSGPCPPVVSACLLTPLVCAEDPRRTRGRSSPERWAISEANVAALGSGICKPSNSVDTEDVAKEKIMQMAARVNATRVPALAAVAARSATVVGNGSVVPAAASEEALAPAQAREAAARPRAAAPQSDNSWLKQLHDVRHGMYRPKLRALYAMRLL